MGRRTKTAWIYVQLNGFTYRINPKHLRQVPNGENYGKI